MRELNKPSKTPGILQCKSVMRIDYIIRAFVYERGTRFIRDMKSKVVLLNDASNVSS